MPPAEDNQFSWEDTFKAMAQEEEEEEEEEEEDWLMGLHEDRRGDPEAL